MIRQADELKTIICEDNGKACICASCIDEKEGYIVNTWVKECPRFEEKQPKKALPVNSCKEYIN